MPKPPCPCTGRTDIRCDAAHCDLAVDPKSIKGQCKGCCPVCWLRLHSEPHRKLWGIDGEALPAPASSPIVPSLPAPQPSQPPVVHAAKPAHAIYQPQGHLRLGDKIEAALKIANITPETVGSVLGSCGGCAGRQAVMNKLSDWAEGVLKHGADASKSLWKKMFGG